MLFDEQKKANHPVAINHYSQQTSKVQFHHLDIRLRTYTSFSNHDSKTFKQLMQLISSFKYVS